MIVGVFINKIDAERSEKVKDGNLSINSTPTVTGVKKKKLTGIGDTIGVEFVFKSVYEPSAGEIKIYGEAMYKTDDADKVLKKWEKEGVLDADLSVEILNAVFTRCLTKAINIAEDLRLPPPVRFPKVTKGGGETTEEDE